MNAMIDDSEILIYEQRLMTDNPLFVYCAFKCCSGYKYERNESAE